MHTEGEPTLPCPCCASLFRNETELKSHVYEKHVGQRLSRPVASLAGVKLCTKKGCGAIKHPRQSCTVCTDFSAGFGSQMPLPAVSEAAASAAGDEQAGTCSQGSQARSTAALPVLSPAQDSTESPIEAFATPGKGCSASAAGTDADEPGRARAATVAPAGEREGDGGGRQRHPGDVPSPVVSQYAAAAACLTPCLPVAPVLELPEPATSGALLATPWHPVSAAAPRDPDTPGPSGAHAGAAPTANSLDLGSPSV